MAWTQRDLVTAALNEHGLAGSVTPGQQQDVNISLGAMMASWEMSGIYLDFPIPTTAKGNDLDDSAVIDVRANEAVYLNLALRIAPANGKIVSQETRKGARAAYNKLLNRATIAPPVVRANGTLAGAGHKDRVFLPNEVIADRTKTVLDLT